MRLPLRARGLPRQKKPYKNVDHGSGWSDAAPSPGVLIKSRSARSRWKRVDTTNWCVRQDRHAHGRRPAVNPRDLAGGALPKPISLRAFRQSSGERGQRAYPLSRLVRSSLRPRKVHLRPWSHSLNLLTTLISCLPLRRSLSCTLPISFHHRPVDGQSVSRVGVVKREIPGLSSCRTRSPRPSAQKKPCARACGRHVRSSMAVNGALASRAGGSADSFTVYYIAESADR